MYYWNYAIKCIIRNIVYKLMKPRNLLIIGVSLLVIFLLSSYSTVFGFEGNNTYTDKNTSIIIAYESINNDLIQRLYQAYNNTAKDDLIYHLKDKDYSYYLYYGQSDGSQMISSSMYNPQVLNIIIYDNATRTINGTIEDKYEGMTTDIATVGNCSAYFSFNGNSLSQGNIPNSVYLPYVLINYHSKALSDYFSNSSQSQTDSIVGAINQQTNTIESQTDVIQDTQDFVTNTTVDDDTMTVDTTSMSVSDSGVNDFYSGFLTTVSNIFNNIDTTVETITIPLLPSGNALILSSDIISKHIVSTPIYTLVQVFWWFVLGRYIIGFVFRMIKWLTDGELAERGIFSFADWLYNYNVIVKSWMM